MLARLHRSAPGAALLAVLLAPLLTATDADALLLYAEGAAGGLSAPTQTAGPSAAGPIDLPATVADAGGRLAEATAHVDAGVIQLSATASAAIGAQSVGNWGASVQGSWEDTITFDADGSIPGLPGVTITPGVTMGTAQLVVDLTGSFVTDAANNTAHAGYSASLGYGLLAPFADRCCGPKWTDFRGQASLSGDQIGAVPPALAFDGDPLPDSIVLDVSFVFGEAFDVIFELSAYAEVGWEGMSPEALFASALLDHTAVWQGPQNVSVEVDDGMGGTMSVALPAGSWSFTSADFDYTDAVAVPEPSTATLLGLALGALAWRRRSATATRRR